MFIKKLLLLLCKNYIMNELQHEIELAMFMNKINKVELSKLLNMSYPTMLSKLDNIGSFKLSEFKKVCEVLKLDFKELLTNI